MSLSAKVIAELKRLATVPVFVGDRETATTSSIPLSPVKIDESAATYDNPYAFVHTVRRNLPDPPE